MLRLLTSARPVKAQNRSLPAVLQSGMARALFATMALLWSPAIKASDNSLAVAGGQNSPPLVIVSPERLLPGFGATVQDPGETNSAFFKLDWSLGLRGSYNNGSSGTGYGAVIAPNISLTHSGLRTQFVLGAQSILSYNQNRITRLEQGQVSASGQYALDRVSQLSASMTASLGQDDPDAPGMEQVLTNPLVLDLEAQAGIARQFSRLGLELKGNISRRMMSETILVGNLVQDNSSLNATKLGASLRASYRLTPIISAFVQGDMAQNWFDAASPVSGLYQNGLDIGATAGLIGNWRDLFGGQVSVGYGLRRFDDPGISQLTSVLYGFDLFWTPNQTVSAGASFSSAINPENTKDGAPASVSYTAQGNIGLGLTSTFGLRASATGNWVVPVNGAEITTSYSAGAGADFKLNKQTNINLDYLYKRVEQPPGAQQDQQAITLGVTFSK